jgi:hypothetical protein
MGANSVRVWKCFALDSDKGICYMQLLVYAPDTLMEYHQHDLVTTDSNFMAIFLQMDIMHPVLN